MNETINATIGATTEATESVMFPTSLEQLGPWWDGLWMWWSNFIGTTFNSLDPLLPVIVLIIALYFVYKSDLPIINQFKNGIRWALLIGAAIFILNTMEVIHLW